MGKFSISFYDANGWLAKDPAGMEYIPVMVAEHEIPLIVSAYQMEFAISYRKASKLLKKCKLHPMLTDLPAIVI